MGRALKDQAQAEPRKSSSSQAQAQALQTKSSPSLESQAQAESKPRLFKQSQAQGLTGLFFSLHKNSNFLGPSQKVKIKPGSSLGPSQNFEPKPKKKTGPGLSPSRALDPLLHRIFSASVPAIVVQCVVHMLQMNFPVV